MHQSHIPWNVSRFNLIAILRGDSIGHTGALDEHADEYTDRKYLARYGHPDTLAVGNAVEIVRFCPRSHLRRTRAPGSGTGSLFGNCLVSPLEHQERPVSQTPSVNQFAKFDSHDRSIMGGGGGGEYLLTGTFCLKTRLGTSAGAMYALGGAGDVPL